MLSISQSPSQESVIDMSVIFRNVIVYIAISSRLFMFSQSCVKVPTSLDNVGCQAVDRTAGAGDIDLVWNYRID